VHFLRVESVLLDCGDAAGALVAPDTIGLDPAKVRLAGWRAIVRADIFYAIA
jgi:hypothetical protein